MALNPIVLMVCLGLFFGFLAWGAARYGGNAVNVAGAVIKSRQNQGEDNSGIVTVINPQRDTRADYQAIEVNTCPVCGGFIGGGFSPRRACTCVTVD